MTRYYFDLIDKDGRAVDEEGLEFSTLEQVEREAARAMADATADSFERPVKPSRSSIEVRDDSGPVMRLWFAVEVERLRTQ
ncbi:hypothetical protein I6F09_19235 [Bradyrhizobium sp. IC3195]|uniref:DUF6894 family protein n=1 Tax=Bradyrhizobium sp. IC3195 TaxID=2793804 RepID=UPI001CD43850|nr:hypothetical protein [Bradyrhizobium sp. IC3195]MCA1470032.1 hypothetical protein [Bradyrhizobium sp. IC3195]